ncbi:MAG: hypothetical protein KC897_06540 [Candidatus Omnitrophica bacterium]|nr:hypothetical protein [Candidatus Omnitrophota bacterium]
MIILYNIQPKTYLVLAFPAGLAGCGLAAGLASGLLLLIAGFTSLTSLIDILSGEPTY